MTYIGQLQGPFTANVNILDDIVHLFEMNFNAEDLDDIITQEAEQNFTVNYLTHIGIQGCKGTTILVNDEEIEIEVGDAQIYEVSSEDMKVTSLKFKENTDSYVLVDFTADITYDE